MGTDLVGQLSCKAWTRPRVYPSGSQPSPDLLIDYNDAGYIRVPTDKSVRLIGPKGDSWTLPPPEAECQRGQLAQTTVYRNCPNRIERYDLQSGFRFPDIALPTPVDLKTATIEVDPVGATYLISRPDRAQIFKADGTLLVAHDNPDATLRVGATWADHVVLKGKTVTFFNGDKVSETIDSQSGGFAIPGSTARLWPILRVQRPFLMRCLDGGFYARTAHSSRRKPCSVLGIRSRRFSPQNKCFPTCPRRRTGPPGKPTG
ncbi:MAG: hypothetical protein R3E66_01935 [bacterium]